MTHEYTLLVGGTIVPGDGAPDATAIAWAAGVILAVGTDEAVRAISRGDSHVVALDGALVTAIGEPLEVGAPADLAIHAPDPRGWAGGGEADGTAGAHSAAATAGDPGAAGGVGPATATIRGGHLVAGAFPGL